MQLIVNLLVNGFAVFVTAYLLSGGIHLSSYFIALVVSILLGIVNTLLKPLLIILTLPINILTLGLFTLIINGLLVLLVAYFVPGFSVKNIWWAILFSIVLAAVNWFLHLLSK